MAFFRKTALCAVFVAVLAFEAQAEGFSRQTVSADASIHSEQRSLTPGAVNWDAVASYDFLVWDGFDLYAGPRIGYYTESVCTAYRDWGVHGELSTGAELYFLMPLQLLRRFVVTCGIASDLCWNFSETEPGAVARLDLFGEVFLGMRAYLGDRLFAELRVDAGEFFYFDPPSPTFVKLGIVAGYIVMP